MAGLLVKICLILNYLGQGAWLAVWRAVIAVGVAVLGVLLVKIVETNTSLRKVFLEA